MQNTEEKPWGHDLDPLASGEARQPSYSTLILFMDLDPLASGEARLRFRQQLRRLTNLDPLASGEARLVVT